MTQRRRALLVAAVIGMGTASTAAVSGSVASPVTLTVSYQPGDYAPLDVHCNPPRPLPGDTYQCRDGCYSNSKTPQGACSHHGGIDHPVNQGNG